MIIHDSVSQREWSSCQTVIGLDVTLSITGAFKSIQVDRMQWVKKEADQLYGNSFLALKCLEGYSKRYLARCI